LTDDDEDDRCLFSKYFIRSSNAFVNVALPRGLIFESNEMEKKRSSQSSNTTAAGCTVLITSFTKFADVALP